jgi:microcystin-dependent protein
MAEPYLGQILMGAFNFAPKGFAFTSGQTLPIAQNTALFSLLGTFYGGDGIRTFALPDLRGRSPMHFGTSRLGEQYAQGQVVGEEHHTLTTGEMPMHVHNWPATAAAAVAGTPPNGSAFAGSPVAPYRVAGTMVPMGAPTTTAGAFVPHENRQPYTVINFVIALQGIFPSRN